MITLVLLLHPVPSSLSSRASQGYALDASRFDMVTKYFATRRLSRRRALVEGGAGIAAGTLAAARLTGDANAHDTSEGTPVQEGQA